ncbi:DUF3307 domain-containing protein [Rheinheimera riviphila]|uniref:DUF3307 domain-containing protein n=1 Tax=Rheinheimera riviphila TaxID=1834037 RepID=A0A437R1T9_9GAMM|nr:DUF3307 domain-containing protein [Rheinheimera riviphila]RVU40769.1 DUF3307 domain-containing protein [Rheinheimera riviphila]
MVDFFHLLLLFLLMHIICDFYLQPKRWVDAKKAKTYRAKELYFHSLLHGISLLIPAMVFGVDGRAAACWVVIVAVSHFMIDLWKVTSPNGEKLSCFVLDQALHITVLAAIALYMTDGVSIAEVLQHQQFSDALLVVLGYLLILKPTSIVIGSILKKYPISGTGEAKKAQVSGIVAGGELIGYLERLLILTFTLVGSYEAVGFVLAAKSIFRFGELNKNADRSMTEYVLIGSLVSVVITTLVGTLLSLELKIK